MPTTALARGSLDTSAIYVGWITTRNPALTVPGGDTLKKAHHFGLAVAAVSAQGPDGTELASFRPTSDRLGVDPEERGNLGRREKRFARGLVSLHVVSLLLPKRPGVSDVPRYVCPVLGLASALYPFAANGPL